MRFQFGRRSSLTLPFCIPLEHLKPSHPQTLVALSLLAAQRPADGIIIVSRYGDGGQ